MLKNVHIDSKIMARKVIHMTIGQRIKQKREELGWSQEELAKRMGYKTRNAIYQYEQVENMKLSMVEKFANVLGCPISDLLDFDDEEQTQKAIKSNEDTMLKLVNIVAFLKQLNDEGYEEALKRIEELTYIPKYKK